MADIKVRVGQQNAVKVISSVSGVAGGKAVTAINVLGGIASVTELSVSGISSLTQLNVSGISTFTGIATFIGDVYIGGDLYIRDDLSFDEFTARNANITGVTTTNNLVAGALLVNTATVTNQFYYSPSYTNGIAYFNDLGLMVSTGSTSVSVDYTNYILTTDNSGIPAWSNSIDGGSY